MTNTLCNGFLLLKGKEISPTSSYGWVQDEWKF